MDKNCPFRHRVGLLKTPQSRLHELGCMCGVGEPCWCKAIEQPEYEIITEDDKAKHEGTVAGRERRQAKESSMPEFFCLPWLLLDRLLETFEELWNEAGKPDEPTIIMLE